MMKAFCRAVDIHILCHEWGMCSFEHLARHQPVPRVLVSAASDTYMLPTSRNLVCTVLGNNIKK